MTFLGNIKSRYMEYLSSKYGVTHNHISKPLDHLMDEVTILNSEDYTEISQEELIQAFDTGFNQALKEDQYVWESDISPGEIETLLSESENFAAAKHTENEGENRYAFLIEGNLQYFDNQYNLAPREIHSINTSPVILTGDIWEKPEKGLFSCQTNFEIS